MAFRSALLIFVASLAACSGADEKPPQLLVSAASDLQFAFEEIAAEFEHRTGIDAVFNFGSSGMLARQIKAGAPADMFFSANIQYVDELKRAGLIAVGTDRIYARGRITVWVRADSPHRLQSVADLANEEIRRLAIADPAHAPYGLAAREALMAAGIWQQVAGKVVYGENIRDTLRFAESGNAEAAIAALSLSVRTNGRYFVVPEQFHEPINQAVGIIRGSPRQAEARAFAAFVSSEEGDRILRNYGFEIP